MDLEREKRAMANWQRIKILLAILKVCGGRMEKAEEVIEAEASKSKTIDDRMMQFIKSPDDSKVLAWDIFSTFFYLIGFIHDSFCIAFFLYPLLDKG